VPARVAKFLPDAKLIVLLRNPVDRAFSHYNHSVRLGFESLSFEDALDAEPARLHPWREGLTDAVSGSGSPLSTQSYLSRGMYHDQLVKWMRLFPKRQLLVLQSESFFDNPRKSIGRVHKFLGLPAQAPADLAPRNCGRYIGLRPATRRRLLDHFRPHNDKLFRLLGERFAWNM
jgi:hypothetical protein